MSLARSRSAGTRWTRKPAGTAGPSVVRVIRPRKPAASCPTTIETPLTRSLDLIVTTPCQGLLWFGFAADDGCGPGAAAAGRVIARTYHASVGSLISNRYLPGSRLRIANSPLAFKVPPKPENNAVIF